MVWNDLAIKIGACENPLESPQASSEMLHQWYSLPRAYHWKTGWLEYRPRFFHPYINITEFWWGNL